MTTHQRYQHYHQQQQQHYQQLPEHHIHQEQPEHHNQQEQPEHVQEVVPVGMKIKQFIILQRDKNQTENMKDGN